MTPLLLLFLIGQAAADALTDVALTPWPPVGGADAVVGATVEDDCRPTLVRVGWFDGLPPPREACLDTKQ